MVYALEGFYRIGPLKRTLDQFRANAKLVLVAYPSIRRAATIGIVAFVLFPVSGTGALVGSFLGIILGLHRAVLIAAVSAGGLLGGLAMGFLASNSAGALQRLADMRDDPTFQYASVAILLALVLAVVWFANRTYKKALERAKLEESELDAPAAGNSPGLS